MSFNNLIRVYILWDNGTDHSNMKGLNACESTVSSELVQWPSVLLTAPKNRYIYNLADTCSSVQVLLFNGDHVCSGL